jgi:proton-dependent oligopeptide transporter, POT family
MSAPIAERPAAATGPLRQPPGLYLLFAVEMWERFSYYGMRALMVLYLVDARHGGLGWDRVPAQRLYGWYGFFAYLLPVVGGVLADQRLGTHRAMVIGALVIAAGHFCLATPPLSAFFVGMALIVIGTGFFKSNVSTMVGQLYGDDDPRRDPGFTIFYMGVNVGALLGPIVCGYLAESPRWGWHWGFGAAGVGMVIGLLVYLRLKSRYLPGIGVVPNRRAAEARGERASGFSPEEHDRVLALLIIYFFTIFFWMAFEQAGSSMNLFAAERTDRLIHGWTLPASWFQSVNSAVILIAAPIFAGLWTALAQRGREPGTPAKMAAGLALLAGGFLFMVVGAKRSEGGVLVSPLWLVAAYTLHTFGELCLSPIGLSLVTRLAPFRLASLFMGLWFLATAAGELLAGQLAALTDRVARGEIFRLLGGQADFYLIFVVSGSVAALGLTLLRPKLRRLMHGRDT